MTNTFRQIQQDKFEDAKVFARLTSAILLSVAIGGTAFALNGKLANMGYESGMAETAKLNAPATSQIAQAKLANDQIEELILRNRAIAEDKSQLDEVLGNTPKQSPKMKF